VIGRGHTVPEVAQRLRVGEDKVRGWIRRGLLKAINTACIGKPRWVITQEALQEFESGRVGGDPPKPPRRKRRATPRRDWV
jgi:excisionase family DNA binding protein